MVEQVLPQLVARHMSSEQLVPLTQVLSSHLPSLQTWWNTHWSVSVHDCPQTNVNGVGLGDGLTTGVGEGDTLGVGLGDGLGDGLAPGITTLIGALQLALNVPEVTFAVLVIINGCVMVDLIRTLNPQTTSSPPVTGFVEAVMVLVEALYVPQLVSMNSS